MKNLPALQLARLLIASLQINTAKIDIPISFIALFFAPLLQKHEISYKNHTESLWNVSLYVRIVTLSFHNCLEIVETRICFRS